MTAPKEQLQVLISEIDGVLQKTTPRLPWVMSGDANQQRKVLERVRNHLVALQKRMTADASDRPQKSPADPLAYDIYYQPSLYQPPGQPQLPPGQPPDLAAPHMVYLLRQEMVQLRTTMIQPLQAELSTLRQQRETLQAEVRQLEMQIEMQRQNYLLQQQASLQHTLNDVLQAWMGRFQDSLAQQMSQSLQGITPLVLSPQARPTLGAAGGWAADVQIANVAAPPYVEAPLPPDPAEAAADRSPSAGFPYPGSEMLAIALPVPAPLDAAIDSWIRDTGADDAASTVPPSAFTDLNLAELSLSQLAAQEIDQEIDQEFDGLCSPENLPLAVPVAAPDRVATVPDSPSQLPSQPPSEPPSEMTDDLDDFYHSLFGSAGTESLAPTGQGAAAAIALPNATASDPRDQINSLTDLFADMPPLSASSSAAPIEPADLRFDAHEVDDSFVLASSEETLLPGATAQLAGEADLELDEITFSSLSEDLFNLERQPVAAAPEPDSGRLTLEDMGSLFMDVMPAAPSPQSALPAPGDTFDLFAANSLVTTGSSAPPAAPPEALFTFDDISALFADADALPVSPAPPSPVPATADSTPASVIPGDFTLGDFTPGEFTLGEFTPGEFTLERLDDLFVEVPALDPATPGPVDNASKSAPLDFTLDQIGNLFMEVPTASPIQAGTPPRSRGDRSGAADPADSVS